MRRAERLYRLVDEMRARRRAIRAEDLARLLEVSPRTVYRDIAHLQASGVPIEGAAGLGYLLRPGHALPPMTFTHDQLDALATGLAFVEGRGDPALATAAHEVRAKLQAALPAPETRALADAPHFAARGPRPDPVHAAPLRAAIRARRVVRLAYADAAGARSDRRLRPLALWSFEAGWMVSGWCELRAGFRTFRFDRIAALEVTEDRFDPGPDTDLRAFFAQEAADAPGPRASGA